MPLPFPARLSEMTVEWLNQVLEARGLLEGRRIVGFESAPASGRGGTSSVSVLALTYDQPAPRAPQKVLAKFSSEIEAVRQAARQHRLYQREIAFYERFGADPGIRTPACYFSQFDEPSHTCLLLLEYIENARRRDLDEGGPEDIERAVRCLAPFHAKWWERDSSLAFIEHEYEGSSCEIRIEKASRALRRIQEGGHGQACGATSLAILELWLARAQSWADYARSRPMTLCHGSLHRGQILFPIQGGASPWIIDWQNVAVNAGAHDLARLVVSGLLPDQRRQYERSLIALYHALLLERGVRHYSFEQLGHDYRLGLAGLIVFHSLILADYPVEVISRYWQGKDSFWEVLFHWPAAAAEDWKVLEWLNTNFRPSPAD